MIRPSAEVSALVRARAERHRLSLQPGLSAASTILFAAIVLSLVATVAWRSGPALGHFGVGFLTGSWLPGRNQYGAGVFIAGTALATGVAMVLAVPVGVGAAVFLAERCPRRLAQPLAALIELLAAVPSIVVGLWGLFILTPLFGHTLVPFLKRVPLIGLAFHGASLGPSVFLAGAVLAVMVLPTLVALSRSALSAVGESERDAARALGATRWQVTRQVVIPAARHGIVAGLVLATGRALGETIAVALVIGNRYALPHSLVDPAATLPSAIINNFAEATGHLELSAIFGLALVLLVLTALVNGAGQWLAGSGPSAGEGR